MGTWWNVLINHHLLVIPMSLYKFETLMSQKHAHRQTHTNIKYINTYTLYCHKYWSPLSQVLIPAENLCCDFKWRLWAKNSSPNTNCNDWSKACGSKCSKIFNRQNQTGKGQRAKTGISEAGQRRKQYQAEVGVTGTGSEFQGRAVDVKTLCQT